MYPVVCSDQCIDAGLLRAEDKQGNLIGTAFSVLADGTCLTCDHVLQAGVDRFVDADGRKYRYEWVSSPDLARCDIAIIRLISGGAPLPQPLPLSPESGFVSFRMRTWLHGKTGIVGSLPVAGKLSGLTEISYEKSHRKYSRQKVLTLTGPKVQPGMSGTPLIDGAADAVFGIVIASYGDELAAGFARPLYSLKDDPLAGSLFRRNYEEVKRYGRHPNPSATAEMAQAANHAVLFPGEAGRLLDPHRFVARAEFSRTVALFLNSSSTALAVYGAVGVGKTTALADFALRGAGHLCFFARSLAIANAGDTIEALLRERIAKAYGDRAELAPDLAALGHAASRSGGRLVILLDGLNEAPIERTALLDQWLPEAIDTLAKLNAKLIFTAKTELRDSLLARDYASQFFCPDVPGEPRPPECPEKSPHPPECREKSLYLGLYSAAEFTEAEAKYGLNAALNEPELRHPLTLRLASEVGITGGVPKHQLSRRLDVFDRLFERLVQRVLDRSGLRNRARVAALCERLAEEAIGSPGQLIMASTSFGEPDEKIFNALLEEAVIEPTPSGFRFFLDALVDYLVSRKFELVPEVERAVTASSIGNINADTIALSAARAVQNGKPHEVAAALGLVIDRLSRHELSLAVTLGDWIVTATPPVPALSAVRAEYLVRRFEAGDFYFSRDVLDRAAWAFEPDLQKTLVRNLMLDTEGYGWRYVDINAPDRRPTTRAYARRDNGVFRAVSKMFEAAPETAFCTLVSLLKDEKSLSHHGERSNSSEATVGSISACLIYAHFAEIPVERIWREIVETAVPFSGPLTHALAREFPEETLQLIEGRLADPKCGITQNVVTALEALISEPEGSAYASRVAAVVAALAARTDDQTHLLFELSRNPTLHLAPGLLAQIARRDYERSAKLGPIAVCTLNGLLTLDEALSLVTADGRTSETAFWRAIFDHLRQRCDPPPELLRRAFDVLRARFPPSTRDSRFAGDLEFLLYHIDLVTAKAVGFFDFLAACLATSQSHIRANFLTVAVPALEDKRPPERVAVMLEVQKVLAREPVTEELRTEMISRFIAAPRACESVDIIQSILRNWSFFPAARLILTASSRGYDRDHENTRLWMLGLYHDLLSGDDKVRLGKVIERVRGTYAWEREAREKIAAELLSPER